MKNYDFDKARKLIAENKENLEAAYLGMYEDWFWTAEKIWEKTYLMELEKDTKIAHINGSSWATPTLRLLFEDGTDKMIECSIGESDNEKPFEDHLGILSKSVQDSITPLESKNNDN